jgi:DNA-binding transcriptional LysR family regulator
MQLPGTEAVKKSVEANLGIGFVSQYAVERECSSGDLKVVPVERFELTRHMELIYRKQKYFSPVAQRFREFVHSYAQDHLRVCEKIGKSI